MRTDPLDLFALPPRDSADARAARVGTRVNAAPEESFESRA